MLFAASKQCSDRSSKMCNFYLEARDSPSTMANVFVAFLSFFADDFSRFFLLALFTLYMVNRAAAEAFLSFLDPVDRSRAAVEVIVVTVLK